MMDLKNKIAVVTGGSGGIGAELNRRLVDAGARVFSLDKVAPKQLIGGVKYFEVDLTNGTAVADFFANFSNEIGTNNHVDLLVNNAGIMRRGDLLNTSESDYDLVMGVNLKSMWLTTKHVFPYLTLDAKILNMSSRHGVEPKIDPAIYSLSKAAVLSLSQIMASSWPEKIIKVAAPGSIDTDLSWHGVKAEDVATKKKTMISTEEIVVKLMELIFAEENFLLFNQADLSYYLSATVKGD